MSLDASVCVVSGGSSGIGRALALALAREGGHVWAIGRSRNRLDSLVAEARENGSAINPVVADLEQPADLETIVREVLSANDRVDLLVHAAGALRLGDLESLSAVDIDRQFLVNLRAPMLLTQMLLPALRRARGQIVFMNSLAAEYASANNAVYAATKAGLKTFADGLRDGVNSDGVRVITVHTGRTATPLQEEMHRFEKRPYRAELLLQPQDVTDLVLASLSLPRSGEVTDVRLRPMVKLPPV